MQIAIISGPAERLVRLGNLIVLIGLVFFLTSCAITPSSDNWDPVRPAGESPKVGLDLSTSAMSAAMAALIDQADQAIEKQQWSQAATTLERALRINPKQAEAWTRMAVVNLGKNNPQQCIHMAKKSNRHAKNNPDLLAYNWLLISRAYQQMGRVEQAEAALTKSNQLQGGR